jgi:hypothetical protein
MWFFVMIFAIPCFWIILNTAYAKMGIVTCVNMTIIILGTMMSKKTLTIEGKYNNYTLHVLADPTYELAYKRALMATAGVIVVFVISRFLFPFLARKELRKGMCDTVNMLRMYLDMYEVLCLLGSYYSKLFSKFMEDRIETALSLEFEKLEAKIQLRIVKHSDLLALAAAEPRIKGKFKVGEVRTCLKCCQFILDRIRSMRLSLKGFGNDVRQDILKPLNGFRKEMIADVLMLFYIITGALHSKVPLPHYLPRARKSRDILLDQMEKLDLIKNGKFHRSNQCILLLSIESLPK